MEKERDFTREHSMNRRIKFFTTLPNKFLEFRYGEGEGFHEGTWQEAGGSEKCSTTTDI
jgi:hypothetical protein